MAQTDVARGTTDSGHDPALANALSEMDAEGSLQSNSPFEGNGDPAPAGETSAASAQPQGTESAPNGAAQSQPDGAAGNTSPAAAQQPTDPAQSTPADDPYAGTEPFVHEFQGEALAVDGVLRVPGEGLLIEEEAIPNFARVLEERHTLDRLNRDYAQQHATTDRLGTWERTGPNGQTERLSGMDGIAAMRVDAAKTRAALTTLLSVFQPDAQGNYPRLTSLLTAGPDGRITLDPQALEVLRERGDAAELRAEVTERSWIGQAVQEARQPAQQQGPDYSTIAPQFIDGAMRKLGMQADALTPDDRALLARQFGRYIRPATDADRRMDPRIQVGLPMVDPEFEALVKDRAALRSSAKAQAKAAEQAGKHNAGMDRARQPAQPATPPARQPAKQDPKAKDGERRRADWDSPLSEALAEMGIAR